MIKVANRRTLGLTGTRVSFSSISIVEMWDKPLEKLEKVDNPTETDETENEKNELVILDCADN